MKYLRMCIAATCLIQYNSFSMQPQARELMQPVERERIVSRIKAIKQIYDLFTAMKSAMQGKDPQRVNNLSGEALRIAASISTTSTPVWNPLYKGMKYFIQEQEKNPSLDEEGRVAGLKKIHDLLLKMKNASTVESLNNFRDDALSDAEDMGSTLPESPWNHLSEGLKLLINKQAQMVKEDLEKKKATDQLQQEWDKRALKPLRGSISIHRGNNITEYSIYTGDKFPQFRNSLAALLGIKPDQLKIRNSKSIPITNDIQFQQAIESEEQLIADAPKAGSK